MYLGMYKEEQCTVKHMIAHLRWVCFSPASRWLAALGAPSCDGLFLYLYLCWVTVSCPAGPCCDSWASCHPSECQTAVSRIPDPSRNSRPGWSRAPCCAASDSEAPGWIRAPASDPGCRPCGSRRLSWVISLCSGLCSVPSGCRSRVLCNPVPGSLPGSCRGCGRGGSPGRRFPGGNRSRGRCERCGFPQGSSWICCNRGCLCSGTEAAWGRPPCEAFLQSMGENISIYS